MILSRYTHFMCVTSGEDPRGPAFARWAGLKVLEGRVAPFDVVVLLDGDDYLLRKKVFQILDRVYHDPDCWFTYGSYAGAFSSMVRSLPYIHDFRTSEWVYGHPRTFRFFLTSFLDFSDFQWQGGDWMTRGTERGMIYAMLEMSGRDRIRCIPELLYQYRTHPKNVRSSSARFGKGLVLWSKFNMTRRRRLWSSRELHSVPPRLAPHYRLQLTAVVLSYDRPQNVLELVTRLENLSSITEILVMNGGIQISKPAHMRATTRFIDDRENNRRFSLFRRHEACKLASNEMVILLDDDQVPTEESLMESWGHLQRDSSRLCGPYSRKCSVDGYCTKLLCALNGNVILVGHMMGRKAIFLQVWQIIQKLPMFQEMVSSGGNGEDLLFYYVYNILFPREPCRTSMRKVLHLNQSGMKSHQNHYDQRDKLCKSFSSPALLRNLTAVLKWTSTS